MRGRLAPVLVKKPHIDAVLSNGYLSAHMELAKLRKKAEEEEPLTPSEHRSMLLLTQQIQILDKIENEHQRREKLEELSNEELLVLTEEAMKIIKGE